MLLTCFLLRPSNIIIIFCTSSSYPTKIVFILCDHIICHLYSPPTHQFLPIMLLILFYFTRCIFIPFPFLSIYFQYYFLCLLFCYSTMQALEHPQADYSPQPPHFLSPNFQGHSNTNDSRYHNIKQYRNSQQYNHQQQEQHQVSYQIINKTSSLRSQCQICSEQFASDLLVNLSNCQHLFCHNCSLQHARQQIKSFKPIKCPAGCEAETKQDSVVLLMLSPEQLQKYRKAQFIRMTDRDGLKRCPNHKCSFGVLVQHEGLKQNSAQCFTCFNRYCMKCWWPEHRGNCNGAAESFIQNKLLFAECPGCKRKIQRTKGCFHITCICKYQFCYLCLGRWSNDHICKQNQSRVQKFALHARHEMQAARERNQINQIRYVRQQGQFLVEGRVEQYIDNQMAIRTLQLNRMIEEQQRQQRRRQQEELRLQRIQEARILQEQRERGLQIIKQFKEKKKGKWRADDDQLNEKLKNLKAPNVSLQPREQIIQENNKNFNFHYRGNTNNNNQSIIDRSQQSKLPQPSQRSSSLLHGKNIRQNFNRMSKNPNRRHEQDVIGSIRFYQNEKQRKTEVRLQKMQQQAKKRQINRLEKMEQDQIRKQKKYKVVARSNNAFMSSNNIF